MRATLNRQGKSIAGMLKMGSNRFRGLLISRGAMWGGTRHCWQNRMELEDVWYIPFSMNLMGVPLKRRPPPDFEGLADELQDFLNSTFEIIR